GERTPNDAPIRGNVDRNTDDPNAAVVLPYRPAVLVAGVNATLRMIGKCREHRNVVSAAHPLPRQLRHAVGWRVGLRRIVLRYEEDLHACTLQESRAVPLEVSRRRVDGVLAPNPWEIAHASRAIAPVSATTLRLLEVPGCSSSAVVPVSVTPTSGASGTATEN